MTDQTVHERWMAAFEPMRVVALDVIELRQQRRERYGYQPAAESRSMAELHATRTLQAYVGTPTVDATNFADLHLLAAEEHLASICSLLEREAVVAFSDKVLVRAAVEAAARALWLMDSSLDATQRACRALTQRFDDLRLYKEFASTAERPVHRAKRDRLIDQCRAAGLPIDLHDGSAHVGDDRMPSERTLLRNLFRTVDDDDLGSRLQSWLSRFVHGNSAGLIEQMSVPPSDVAAPTAPAGQVTRAIGNDSNRANFVAGLSALGYLTAADRWIDHQGWADEEWCRSRANARATIAGIVEGHR